MFDDDENRFDNFDRSSFNKKQIDTINENFAKISNDLERAAEIFKVIKASKKETDKKINKIFSITVGLYFGFILLILQLLEVF